MSGPAPDGPLYDETYYRETFGRDRIVRGSMAWWSVRFYAAVSRRCLAGRRGRGRVLDLGCAHGWLLARLEGLHDTWGVDVSPYAVAQSRSVAPRSRILAWDLSSGLPPELREIGFDLIVARYLLEHLAEPERLLESAVRALSPGGFLLASVPDLRSPGRRLKGKEWFAYRDPTHVSLWEAARWEAALRRSGLEIVRQFSDGLWDVPYLRRVPAFLQYPLFSLPAAVQVLAGRALLPAGWGENLIVIARRGGPAGRAAAAGEHERG